MLSAWEPKRIRWVLCSMWRRSNAQTEKCPTSENREERVTEDFAEVYDFFYGFQHLKRSIQAKISWGK